MSRNELTVPMDRIQPTPFEFVAVRALEQAGTIQQVPGDCPVHEPYRIFECTRPRLPQWIWTLIEPGFQQQAAGVSMALLPRQEKSLRQRHQFIVTVDFPQIFDIADRAFITIIERLPEPHRRVDTGFRVAIPQRRKAELTLAHCKDIEAARQYPIGHRQIRRGVDLTRQVVYPAPSPWPRDSGRRMHRSSALAFQPGPDRLAAAPQDFRQPHQAQAIELPCDGIHAPSSRYSRSSCGSTWRVEKVLSALLRAADPMRRRKLSSDSRRSSTVHRAGTSPGGTR